MAVPIPFTGTGVNERRRVPLPSTPKSLLPQQATVRSDSIAHVWSFPAAMAVALRMRFTRTGWTRRHRYRTVAVPQLPGRVPPPALDPPAGQQRARVRLPGSNRGGRVDALHRHRAGRSAVRAVTQLPQGVVAPALDPPAGQQRTRVLTVPPATGTDRDRLADAGHRQRGGRLAGPSGLPRVRGPPTHHHPVRQHGTRVPALGADRDRRGIPFTGTGVGDLGLVLPTPDGPSRFSQHWTVPFDSSAHV